MRSTNITTANKRPVLLELLVQIAIDQNRPISLVEFVRLAFEAGFRTVARQLDVQVLVAVVGSMVSFGNRSLVDVLSQLRSLVDDCDKFRAQLAIIIEHDDDGVAVVH